MKPKAIPFTLRLNLIIVFLMLVFYVCIASQISYDYVIYHNIFEFNDETKQTR